MAWYSDWQARKDRLLRDGLLVLVRGVDADPGTGFICAHLEANEGDLPRSNVDRGFGLHLTIGFVSDYNRSVALDAVERMNARWHGRLVRLRIDWMGSGGAAYLANDDPLAMDPDISWLHPRGWYGNGHHVKPRGLHVSL